MHTLKDLIDSGQVTPRVIALMKTVLVDLLSCMTCEYELKPENIIVDLEHGTLSLADTEEGAGCSDIDFSAAIHAYGEILLAVANACPKGAGSAVDLAVKCMAGEYKTFPEISLALERKRSNAVYIPLIIIIAALLAVLVIFS